MVPPALLAVTMVFMPQSPVFLVSKGRQEQERRRRAGEGGSEE
jgi:hypothetical protein